MDARIKARLAEMLCRPRPLKPQTERQLAPHLAEHSSKLSTFLMCAGDILEEYELDIVFGPLFTPTLDERAELSDLLTGAQPTSNEVDQLVKDLSGQVHFASVLLPDGTRAQLALHEVMIERYIRLLRLDQAPDGVTVAALRRALPSDLLPIAVALCCERGMTPAHQRWFAAFAAHVAARHSVTRAMLETATEFIAQQQQQSLDHDSLLAAAEALSRATEGTAAYAASGHAYWSPDVAQHHHYRGEGKVDQERLEQRHAEAERVAMLVEDLRTFGFERADEN
jgi:hypothetical protein